MTPAATPPPPELDLPWASLYVSLPWNSCVCVCVCVCVQYCMNTCISNIGIIIQVMWLCMRAFNTYIDDRILLFFFIVVTDFAHFSFSIHRKLNSCLPKEIIILVYSLTYQHRWECMYFNIGPFPFLNVPPTLLPLLKTVEQGVKVLACTQTSVNLWISL